MAFSRLGRRSRRRRDGGVPRWWETSQSVAADLHRRMHRSLAGARRTVADAQRCGVPTQHYDRLCDELDEEARAIDAQLLQASQLPMGVRHRALHDLRYRIADLERTGGRIGRTALEAAAPATGGVEASPRHINERLDQHLEARAELRQLGPG